MDILSNDICYEIFNNIDKLSDAAHFAQICKQIYAVWAKYCRKMKFAYRAYYEINSRHLGINDMLALVYFAKGHNQAFIISPCSFLTQLGQIMGIKMISTSFAPLSCSESIINFQCDQTYRSNLTFAFVELRTNPMADLRFPSNRIIFWIEYSQKIGLITISGPADIIAYYDQNTNETTIYDIKGLAAIKGLLPGIYDTFELSKYVIFGPIFKKIMDEVMKPGQAPK